MLKQGNRTKTRGYFSLRTTAKINKTTAEEQKITINDWINFQNTALMSKR